MIPATACPSFDWLRPTRRETVAVGNIGGSNVPVVISNRINGESTACENKDATPDYISSVARCLSSLWLARATS